MGVHSVASDTEILDFVLEEDGVAKLDRRDFLKRGSIVTAGTFFAGSTRTHLLAAAEAEPAKPIAANDSIQIALIGGGGQASTTRVSRCRCQA